MLYVIIFALLGTLGGVLYLSHRERQTWALERRELLNRIQAPHAATMAAANELVGEPESHHISDMERIRRKAEDMGIPLDDLRIPDAWVGSSY